MKRMTLKTLAIILGLSLGWYVAGITTTFAADDHNDHATQDSHATHDHAAHDGHDHDSYGNTHGNGHASADAEAAQHLVPASEHDIAWYPKIIYSIIILFIVAIIIGLICKSQGLREPGIVASEEDAEKAHGADEEDPHH